MARVPPSAISLFSISSYESLFRVCSSKEFSLFLQALYFFSSCRGTVCFKGLEQTADYWFALPRCQEPVGSPEMPLPCICLCNTSHCSTLLKRSYRKILYLYFFRLYFTLGIHWGKWRKQILGEGTRTHLPLPEMKETFSRFRGILKFWHHFWFSS